MGTLREQLNRLRWDARASSTGVVLEVRTRDRGVEQRAEVGFESVLEILPAGIIVAGDTFLPYHRVVRVRRGPAILWPPTREGET